MRRLVERSVWLVILGVVGLLATAVVTFVWGLAKTYTLARLLIDDGASSNTALVALLESRGVADRDPTDSPEVEVAPRVNQNAAASTSRYVSAR